MRTHGVLAFVSAIAFMICPGCWESPMPDVPQDVIAIIKAIDAGDEGRLQTLLENGAVPTPAGSPLSPIHAAITHFADGKLFCDTKAMRLLLDHGANPNFIDQDSGFAPLEEALSMGEMECITLLKAAGASINTHGKSGQSLMQFAVKGVVRSQDITLLQLVKSWGVSPNVVMGDGRAFTALHEAAWINTPQMADIVVHELLRLGADPCISDRGQTPLDVAENLKGSPVVQAMLRSAMKECPGRLTTRSSGP
jgi:ankyrin repeat protein